MKHTIDYQAVVSMTGRKSNWHHSPQKAYLEIPIHTPVNHQHERMNMDNESSQETNHLKAVFDNYFSLKDALVKFDGNGSSATAKDLQTAINAIKMDKLEMDVLTVWKKVINELKTATEHIYETKGRNSPERTFYEPFKKYV